MKSSFTYKNYKKVLKKAQNLGFKFTKFSKKSDVKGKNILLRHDVDLSLEKALEMAKLESKLGIISTFFIRVNSTFYNIFEERNHYIVTQILLLGHNLGLHFDPLMYKNFNLSINEGIKNDIKILQFYFKIKIEVVSQHRPFLLGKQTNKFIENYSAYSSFYMKKFKYISDSCQNWREFDLEVALQKFDKIQVLIHPEWWGDKEVKWKEHLDQISRILIKQKSDKIKELKKRYSNYLIKISR